MQEEIEYCDTLDLPDNAVLELYRALEWAAAQKPEALCRALAASHSLVSAWHREELVGLGNTLSDGHLVVYYSHLLVLPAFQGQGIGHGIVQRLQVRYTGFHQHVVVADGDAVGFYHKCGFETAGRTRSMWIYAGDDH
jgi:GNAT superfamily N-acetyltransferase